VKLHCYKGLLVLGALMAIALVATFSVGSTARAQTVPTSATVNGGASAPVIECKWELPDMDQATAGIQYTAPYDDSATVPGPPVPCDLQRNATGSATGSARMADGVHHMIQVRPWDHTIGLPIPERTVELWVAAEHPSGIAAISDVYWDVYQPNAAGGFDQKVQVHFDSPATPQSQYLPGDLGTAHGLGQVTASSSPNCAGFTSMFNAAVQTGQLTGAAVNDSTYGMIALCQQQVKAFYHASFELDKDQPCGEYKIVATAVAVGGNLTQLTNYIDVICSFNMQLDFNAVNWGTIIPGIKSVAPGDLVWNTPLGANPPTVANGNNDGMGVQVNFGTMTGTAHGKTITSFDACFGRSPATLYCVDPIAAGTATDLTTRPAGSPTPNPDPAQVLCANELGKLDFSIHPPASLPNDSYVGTMTIIGYHVPGMCLGNVHR
jgi:hypothetical protein